MRDEGAREVNEGEMVGGLALVSDEERPEAVVPAVGSLDHPAPRLLPANRSSERRFAATTDVAADAPLAQVAFGLRIVVALVEAEVLGTPWTSRRAEHHRIERLADHIEVGDVRSRQHDGQGNAPAVGQDVALGAEFPAITGTRARVLPPFGAFTMTPSREHQARSAPTVPS